jgi:hypothetical protein
VEQREEEGNGNNRIETKHKMKDVLQIDEDEDGEGEGDICKSRVATGIYFYLCHIELTAPPLRDAWR